MKVVLAQRAEADLRDIVAYVLQDNPVAAAALVERIEACVDRLAEFPESGRSGRRQGTRELVVSGTPYVVAYRVGMERVEVARVPTEQGAGRGCCDVNALSPPPSNARLPVPLRLRGPPLPAAV